MRLDKRWWLVLVLLGAIALFYAFGLGRFLSLEAIKSSQADVEVWRASRPLLAALLFFGGYTIVVALTHGDGTVQPLSTRSIVIATGARPFVPPIEGIDQVDYLTSENIWRLHAYAGRRGRLAGRLLALWAMAPAPVASHAAAKRPNASDFEFMQFSSTIIAGASVGRTAIIAGASVGRTAIVPFERPQRSQYPAHRLTPPWPSSHAARSPAAWQHRDCNLHLSACCLKH